MAESMAIKAMYKLCRVVVAAVFGPTYSRAPNESDMLGFLHKTWREVFLRTSEASIACIEDGRTVHLLCKGHILETVADYECGFGTCSLGWQDQTMTPMCCIALSVLETC
jgi:hypothetical protein